MRATSVTVVTLSEPNWPQREILWFYGLCTTRLRPTQALVIESRLLLERLPHQGRGGYKTAV